MVMMTTSHLLALLALCAEATSFAPHPAFTTPRCSPSSSQLHVAAASVGAVTTENLNLLSERGRDAILSLIQNDPHGAQVHVYGGWPQAGVEDEGKKQLADQVSGKSFRYYIWTKWNESKYPVCYLLKRGGHGNHGGKP